LQLEAGSTVTYPVTAVIAALIPAPLRRVVRYGCVGVTISLLYGLAVIAFMRVLHPISPTAASVAAFLVTSPLSYLAHRRVSFSDRPYDSFQPLRFAFSTVTSFVVAVGGMYWITEIVGQSYLLGIAWNWVIIPTMNFLTYMFWVFRTTRNKGGAK
jgi:putative flippase GtrA